jgi:hypothetical protein
MFESLQKKYRSQKKPARFARLLVTARGLRWAPRPPKYPAFDQKSARISSKETHLPPENRAERTAPPLPVFATVTSKAAIVLLSPHPTPLATPPNYSGKLLERNTSVQKYLEHENMLVSQFLAATSTMP